MNTAPTTDAVSSTTAAPAAKRKGRSIPELAALMVVLIALIVYFSISSPVFLHSENLLNILTAIAVTGIIAIPATMLLVSAQVDLSVGSGAAFAGVVLAAVGNQYPIFLGVIAALMAGLIVGAINGYLVSYIGVNSLITTLGTLAVFRGLTQLTADGQTILFSDFGALGTARPLLNIPLPVLIFVAIVIIGAIVMRNTVFGRQLYAIGANPVAARLVGIKSRRTLFLTFLFSGFAMALAGMILTSQLSAASPISATGLELTVVTAVVLGGASLSGGQGTIGGTAIGLLILGVLNNGLVLNNVSSFWQDVARGTLLIAAVSFDQIRRRMRSTRA